MPVCVNVNVNFNVVLMVTQTHTQRMGPRPILRKANITCKHLNLVSWIPFFASHVNAHADVTCKQSFMRLFYDVAGSVAGAVPDGRTEDPQGESDRP